MSAIGNYVCEPCSVLMHEDCQSIHCSCECNVEEEQGYHCVRCDREIDKVRTRENGDSVCQEYPNCVPRESLPFEDQDEYNLWRLEQ